MLTSELKQPYIVIGTTRESDTVSTVKLVLPEGTVPPYRAGQFITVYFPELNTPEGKAYSMSGAPHEDCLSITVKAIGEFSKRICGLRQRDTVVASLPYGYFYSESDTSTLIMIAGGIGVTPFRSMIRDALSRTPARKLALFHSARTYDDLIFRDEFRDIQKSYPQLSVHHFVTREHCSDPEVTARRISITDVMKHLPESPGEREFMICGSIGFVGDMWKGLKDAGIPEEAIYTEAFFSH